MHISSDDMYGLANDGHLKGRFVDGLIETWQHFPRMRRLELRHSRQSSAYLLVKSELLTTIL